MTNNQLTGIEYLTITIFIFKNAQRNCIKNNKFWVMRKVLAFLNALNNANYIL